MKPEKTNLIEIGYIKEEKRYFATFHTLDLDKNEIERIIKCFKILGNQRGFKHYIKDNDLYIIDFIEADLFESMYTYMIGSAKQGIIPERMESEKLNIELDICMMEQDIDFSVRMAADPRRCMDILKGAIDD